jgi:hypothetical protein
VRLAAPLLAGRRLGGYILTAIKLSERKVDGIDIFVTRGFKLNEMSLSERFVLVRMIFVVTVTFVKCFEDCLCL